MLNWQGITNNSKRLTTKKAKKGQALHKMSVVKEKNRLHVRCQQRIAPTEKETMKPPELEG